MNTLHCHFGILVLAHCAVLGTCLNAFFILGSPALQKSPTKVPQQGADANTLAHLGGVANNPVLNPSYTQTHAKTNCSFTTLHMIKDRYVWKISISLEIIKPEEY